MLEAQAREIAESLEIQQAKRELDLLGDDIIAARRQHKVLREESDQLSHNLKNLEFRVEELTVEREQLEPDQSMATTDHFFEYLSFLEQSEIEGNGRLDGQRKLSAEFAHQINGMLQKRKKQEAERDRLKAALENERQVLLDSNDALIELQGQVATKTSENEFLIEKCEELKEELTARGNESQTKSVEKDLTLRQTVKKLKEDLLMKRQEADKKHRELGRMVHEGEKRAALRRSETERAVSVSSWRAERSVMLAKLKKLKTTLFSEQRTRDMSVKRDKDLADKLQELTGSATCESDRVKAVLAAELKSHTKVEGSGSSKIDKEKTHSDVLNDSLQVAIDSLATFEDYKTNKLGSLNDELAQSMNRGYLDMLRDELAVLQSRLVSK